MGEDHIIRIMQLNFTFSISFHAGFCNQPQITEGEISGQLILVIHSIMSLGFLSMERRHLLLRCRNNRLKMSLMPAAYTHDFLMSGCYFSLLLCHAMSFIYFLSTDCEMISLGYIKLLKHDWPIQFHF